MTKKIIPLIVILCITVCMSALWGWPVGDESKPPDHFARQLRRDFYLADKNLFDARFILAKKEKIALSEQQVQKIESIKMTYQESAIRKSAEIKIRELRFTSYIKSGKIEKKEMASHIREIGKQKTDWVVDYINYLLDLRDVLTDKQLETLGKIAAHTKKSSGTGLNTHSSKKSEVRNRE